MDVEIVSAMREERKRLRVDGKVSEMSEMSGMSG